jgi:hypothetical protein
MWGRTKTYRFVNKSANIKISIRVDSLEEASRVLAEQIKPQYLTQYHPFSVEESLP